MGRRPTLRSLIVTPAGVRLRFSSPPPSLRREPPVCAPPAPANEPLSQPIESLLEGFCPEPRPDEQLAIHSNGQMLFVSLSDIEWLEAVDQGVKLRVGKHTHRLRDTFAAVAAKLPPTRFMQISRTTLVNVDHILGLQRLLFDEYEVVLRTGKRLPLARGYGLPLPPSNSMPPPA